MKLREREHITIPGRFALGMVALVAAWLPLEGSDAINFDLQVAPIFEKSCYSCHGPEEQKSRLRLDLPSFIAQGGDSGEPLYLRGNPDASHLIKLVSRIDPHEVMPPVGKGQALIADEVDVLRQWIREGAVLPGVDPLAHQITTDHWSFQALKAPEVPDSDLPNEIDAFIIEKLRKSKLNPSPQADRRTLIRRLSLVVHGLPPTENDLNEFLKDKSPSAWPDLVDRMLASPRFGERLARQWLDVVRFAESNGFETNRERLNAYPYRDYVIDSFNEDKPYDQFVREQIAGDALGVDVATGFLVAGPYDIVKSPDVNLTLMQRQDELADMVNTTGTTFLGLTLGCARCHNHKFDPVTQKDYYAFQAIFSGVSYGDRVLPVLADSYEGQKLSSLREELRGQLESVSKLKASAGTRGGGESISKREPVNAQLNREAFPPVHAQFMRFNIRKTNASEPCLDELSVFTPGGMNVALKAVPKSSGDLEGYAIHKLTHVNDGQQGNNHSWICRTEAGWVQLRFPEVTEISRIEWGRDREGRFEDRLATNYDIEVSEDGLHWVVVASSADRKPFLNSEDPLAFLADLQPQEQQLARKLLAEITGNREEISRLEKSNLAWIGNFRQPGATHRLYRGDPLAPREEVAPDALEVLGSLGMSFDETEKERRVKLAEWITSQKNPLTARVMVNRLWQFVFGTGIVETPSDFGGNGLPPSHPELLDWLASDFIASGWSTKSLLRKILISETFKQASQPRDEAASIDAGARTLWRFPPRRLEAEAIRDSILAVTGVLDLEATSGPGFYLLDVDRENVAHYHPKERTGSAEWRRMIYLFKIRQEQDSVFGAFDCPDGSQVTPKRTRSTTPLQALNLFNSDFIIQQASLLAAAVEGGDPAVVVIERLYGRPANPSELADAGHFISEHGLKAFCRAMLNTNEFLFIF